MKNQLNFENLSKEQIEAFIESISIDVEVDAYVNVSPESDGKIYESSLEALSPSGWLSGHILDIPFGDYFQEGAHELILKALQAFKDADGNMEKAQDELRKLIPGI